VKKVRLGSKQFTKLEQWTQSRRGSQDQKVSTQSKLQFKIKYSTSFFL